MLEKRHPSEVRTTSNWYVSPRLYFLGGAGSDSARRGEVDDQVGANLGTVAVQLDDRVGDEMLGRFVGRVVAAGLGDESLSSIGRTPGGPDRCLLHDE
jgi:hypothetical protein